MQTYEMETSNHKNEFIQPPAAVFVVPVKQEPEEDSAVIDPLAVMHGEKTDCLVELQIKEEPTSKELDIQAHNDQQLLGVDKSSDLTETGDANDDDTQNDENIKEEQEDTEQIEFECHWNVHELKEENNLFKSEKPQTLEVTDEKDDDQCSIVTEEETLFNEFSNRMCNQNTEKVHTHEKRTCVYPDSKRSFFGKLLSAPLKPHIQGKLLCCNKCNLCFTTKDDLVKHKLQISEEIPFLCFSKNSATMKNNPNIHMLPDAVYLPFQCMECKRSFSQKHNLVTHMRTHTGYKPFQCSECQKSFSQKNNLDSHMRIHTGYKPFQCSECENSFSRKHHLNSHMQTHTGFKPFQCSECAKSFSQKNNLDRHMRIHTGYKSFQCNECEKSFSRKNDVVQHMKTHTGFKRFQCNVCEKSFSRKNNLVQHMQTHTGYKPFQCSECEKSFFRKNDVVQHMKTHTGCKWFQCNECKKSFSRKNNLVQHMQTHTGY